MKDTMKKRIISAAVAVALFAGLIALKPYTSVPIILAVAVLSALAVYEIIYNTGINRFAPMVIISVLYAAFAPLCFSGWIDRNIFVVLSTLFVCVVFAFGVFAHRRVNVQQCIETLALPIIIAYAFSALLRIFLIPGKTGILDILLLCGFAWITDTGAYFTGVLCGKHKLAPEISPKKTIEGCVGGIVLCAVYTFAVSFAFIREARYALIITALSPLFSVAGMVGDLSASLIKRAYNIKDYGKIMPGHGGVMDRFDSILFIAPLFLIIVGWLRG